jgi:PIN domain nuclease of toxin-antitoxin system
VTGRAVLDASAALAAILGEPGAGHVLDLNADLYISAVNAAEVRTRLIDRGALPEEIDCSLDVLGAETIDFTGGDAVAVAGLRPATRSAGLSLGDRACLALAGRLGATAMTADRAWTTLQLPVEVEVIR